MLFNKAMNIHCAGRCGATWRLTLQTEYFKDSTPSSYREAFNPDLLSLPFDVDVNIIDDDQYTLMFVGRTVYLSAAPAEDLGSDCIAWCGTTIDELTWMASQQLDMSPITLTIQVCPAHSECHHLPTTSRP